MLEKDAQIVNTWVKLAMHCHCL